MIKKRPYQCTQCGHKIETDTNHTGSIWPHCQTCNSQALHQYIGDENPPKERTISKMRIRIAKDAAEKYKRDRTISGGRLIQFSQPWYLMLQALAGEWLTVETDHLFDDQFNTAPIVDPDAIERILNRLPDTSYGHLDAVNLIQSQLGARIMEYCVDAIEYDARIGKYKCGWCGYSHITDPESQCPNCKKPDNEYNYPPQSYFKDSPEIIYKKRGYDWKGQPV